ncbi:chemotaxis-specific protein-glutamate methyltransferase CheB [Pseudooceanicola sp. 216_PA32_1]|uniref:Protein-glutamate methylesterase/protein-glutamine glutaminase n=1 Tax=Pseudooceanicola pacificus TaxID=2676438 RepID=A0A844W0N0_9RHOB|nr:chemotaxis response regulator protein-glutamate methylesterase [Pseudooceanicola pacificus]MWB77287.1 chemotaxis-specific protein-glutamate methyltransferase CheB [Pseudooceanicola pacificus]
MPVGPGTFGELKRPTGIGVKRVLIVDDSHAIQRLLGHALESDPRLRVVGIAKDAYDAREQIRNLEPDVVVLDVEMPRMSGLDFLERIMRLRPMPVVMFSSVTQNGSDAAIRALALGAVDCVAKPNMGITRETLGDLADRVFAAANAGVLKPAPLPTESTRKLARDAVPSGRPPRHAILIGSSTGGVAAVEIVLRGLPADCPPVVVAQHMPESYLESFAIRLNGLLPQVVQLAEHGMPLKSGHIYLSPGGHAHTGVNFEKGRFSTVAIDAPKRNGHCPSVDVLFQSAVGFADRVVATILTGLGKDGAEGMKQLRSAGAYCIGQDEASCVVYGMPRAAADLDALDEQLPLNGIADAIVSAADQRAGKRIAG